MTVDPDDVAVLLGRVLTDDEEDRVDRLIAMAEAQVQSLLPGFSFEAGTEEVTLYPADGDVFWTPKYPVTAVNGVSVGGVSAPANTYSFTELGKITRFDPAYVINAGWAGWESYGPIVVDYDFGLETVPADMAMAVAEIVAGRLRTQNANPDGATSTSESIDGAAGNFTHAETFSSSSAGEIGAGFSAAVLPRRWQRTRQVSVPLRS